MGRQTDDLYKKTGSRNLADITRFMINRHTNVPIEDVLFNAMRDISIVFVAAFIVWIAFQPEVTEILETSFSSLLNLFKTK